MEGYREYPAQSNRQGAQQPARPAQPNAQRPGSTSTFAPNPQRPVSAPFALTPPTTAPSINGTTVAPKTSAPVSSRTVGNASQVSPFVPRKPHAQRPNQTATAFRPPRPASGNGLIAASTAPGRNAVTQAHPRLSGYQQPQTTNGANQQTSTNNQHSSTNDLGTERMQAVAPAHRSDVQTPAGQGAEEFTYERAIESFARSLMAEKAKTNALVAQAMGSVAAAQIQGSSNGAEKAPATSESRSIVPLNRNSAASHQATASNHQTANQNSTAKPNPTPNPNPPANPTPSANPKPLLNTNQTANPTPQSSLQQKPTQARAVPSITEFVNMFYPCAVSSGNATSHSLTQQMANLPVNQVLRPPAQGRSTPPVPGVQSPAQGNSAMHVHQASHPSTQQPSAASMNGLRRPATPSSNQAPRSSTPISNQAPRPSAPASNQIPRPAIISAQQNSVLTRPGEGSSAGPISEPPIQTTPKPNVEQSSTHPGHAAISTPLVPVPRASHPSAQQPSSSSTNQLPRPLTPSVDQVSRPAVPPSNQVPRPPTSSVQQNPVPTRRGVSTSATPTSDAPAHTTPNQTVEQPSTYNEYANLPSPVVTANVAVAVAPAPTPVVATVTTTVTAEQTAPPISSAPTNEDTEMIVSSSTHPATTSGMPLPTSSSTEAPESKSSNVAQQHEKPTASPPMSSASAAAAAAADAWNKRFNPPLDTSLFAPPPTGNTVPTVSEDVEVKQVHVEGTKSEDSSSEGSSEEWNEANGDEGRMDGIEEDSAPKDGQDAGHLAVSSPPGSTTGLSPTIATRSSRRKSANGIASVSQSTANAATSQSPKAPVKTGPWKFHALVEEEFIDGVWQQVGEVEGMHISPSARSSSRLPTSASQDVDEASERGRSRGRRTRATKSEIADNPLLKTTKLNQLAREPEQAEPHLVAFFGSDFREKLQISAKNHLALLRLASAATRHGWTSEKVLETLLSVRDARLAGRKKDSKPGDVPIMAVLQTDMYTVLKEISGWEPDSTVKTEGSARRDASAVSQRGRSSRPSIGRPKRKAVVQSDESDEVHRELPATEPRRYNEDDSASESDEEETRPLRKRARHERDTNGAQSVERVDTQPQTLRTPMDRLMIQSFLNFSESAPDALGTGQEMNLRFADYPPIPGEGAHSGYRLSPLHLGRLDDLLGIGLPVPLTSSTAAEQVPASGAGSAGFVNGTEHRNEAPLPPIPMDVDPVPNFARSVVVGSVSGAVAESTALHGEAPPVSTGSLKPAGPVIHAPATSTSTAVPASSSPVPTLLIAPQVNPMSNLAPSNGPTSWAALRERNGERNMSAN